MNRKRVKVSVIMPAYNAAKYIRTAIESVLAQDFDSCELLLGNDGSKDGTLKIMNQYRSHPKIRVFSWRNNRGAAAARNCLVRRAFGKYITPCDADDMLLPGHLKTFSACLDRQPRIGLVYGNYLALVVNENNRLLKDPFIYRSDGTKKWDILGYSFPHGGSMMRKAIFSQVGGYDERISVVHAWSLWLKFNEVSKAHYLSEGVYYLWRCHPRSLTKGHRKPAKPKDFWVLFLDAVERRYRKALTDGEIVTTR